ncbi:hypothetical protein Bca52824_082129 [Brassica carinata]|uniref:Sulfotransferase n=1 Tax=Brassica carinata TaxID=52824 RepID=A0A8X7PK01_BRACI|nr:hypothetical protein Bca52824_082129 [Brassica carinata]
MLDADFQGAKIYNYQGCWYRNFALQAVIDFQRNFKPTDTDIILASYPKSGTTWAKALTVALLERSVGGSCNNHPLASGSPHMLVPFFELDLYRKSPEPDLTKFPSSPRVFSTHMPLHTLRQPLMNAPCKIVYMCRNVKDVLVSRWHFYAKMAKKEVERSDLESMVESFCRGVHYFGPFWDSVLSYWRGSLEDPEHVLFMKYEDLKAEPCAQVMRLAEFLGCPFSQEEKRGGSVEKILELCSFGNLSSFDVNHTGTHNIFFRKGEVDDWKNHLTTEMQKKIDMVIQEKFQGSGLEF